MNGSAVRPLAVECQVWVDRKDLGEPLETAYYAARQALVIHLATVAGLKTGHDTMKETALDMYVAGTAEHIRAFLTDLRDAYAIFGLTVDVASGQLAQSLEDTFGTDFTFEVGNAEYLAQL